jgi:hypothetical protein
VGVIPRSKTTSIDELKELYKGSLSLQQELYALGSLCPIFFENAPLI